MLPDLRRSLAALMIVVFIVVRLPLLMGVTVTKEELNQVHPPRAAHTCHNTDTTPERLKPV